MNKIEVHGRLLNTPVYTHTCAGERVFEAVLIVPRESGAEDMVLLALGEYTLARRLDVMLPGTAMRVVGEIRNYRNKTQDGPSRKTMVFAKEMHLDMAQIGKNAVMLTGQLQKKPVFRTTPFGRQLCEMMVRVERGHGNAEMITLLAWNRMAQMAAQLEAGECIACEGRLQSREYQKVTADGEKTYTTYEVSLTKMRMVQDAEPASELK